MPVEVKLPQWGMGMREGTITEWLVAEGDVVASGDDMAEIEAEKASSILEAPRAGTVWKILVQEEETVPIYTVLAVLLAPDEAPA
jgi:2-oxoglutarate dehydrogenase E2 component (dihydrolipoamide succinyltransferase)